MAQGSAVQVRDADFADPRQARAVVEILDAYAREPVVGGRPLAAEVRSRLAASLDAHPTTSALLAWAGEKAVGVTVCVEGFSTFAARPLLNVHDLAVLSPWRRRGVGRALLRAVEERARARGCCRITLEVREDNHAARALYQELGFEGPATSGEAVLVRFLEKPL